MIDLGSCHNRYGINHHLNTINNITIKPLGCNSHFIRGGAIAILWAPVLLVQARVGPRGGRGDLYLRPGKEISCAVIVEPILPVLEARDNRLAGARYFRG